MVDNFPKSGFRKAVLASVTLIAIGITISTYASTTFESMIDVNTDDKSIMELEDMIKQAKQIEGVWTIGNILIGLGMIGNAESTIISVIIYFDRKRRT